MTTCPYGWHTIGAYRGMDHHRALGVVILQGPRVTLFLMSEALVRDYAFVGYSRNPVGVICVKSIN